MRTLTNMRNNSGLTAAEKFCLDAYVVNRNVDLAYKLSRPTPPTTTKADILHRMALRWLRGDAVKRYLQQRAAANNVAMDNEATNNRSNEDIIHDLNALLDKTADPKLKAQMLVQLAQLKGMTRRPQDEVKAGSHMNYYLPPRCSEECKLYLAYGKFLLESGIEPTEMEWQMLDAYTRWLHRQQLAEAEAEVE